MRVFLGQASADSSSTAVRLFGGADWIVRSLLGLVLIAAAVMKAVSAPQPTVLSAGWLGVGLVIGEAILGLLLLLNLFPAVTRLAALVVFSGFAAYSLRAVLAGRSTCGCFGDVSIAPQATLALDLLAITMLVLTMRCGSKSACGRWPDWLFRACVASVPLALLGAGYLADRAGATRDRSNLVIFDPKEWIGRRFPLLDEIDIGDDLSRGAWTVLLYRHDCPKCEVALTRYSVGSDPNACEEHSVALIELPPHREATSIPAQHGHGAARLGRIDAKSQWFIQTPCEIHLRDGAVVAEITDSTIPSYAEAIAGG